jgi:hypothetical protein
MDDPSKGENGAAEKMPSKMKAKDNRWYLLTTLYGVPEFRDDELKNKNRDAWNRYFARNLDGPRRAQLIRMKRHSLQELTAAPLRRCMRLKQPSRHAVRVCPGTS